MFRWARRLSVNSRARVYSTDASGIISSIPNTPISSPPMVTATSTHIPGRPMEVPTTLG